MKVLYRLLALFTCFGLMLTVLMLNNNSNERFLIKRQVKEVDNVVCQQEMRDWHDYEFMFREKSRVGLGEQGEEVILTNPEQIKTNERLYNKTGFSVVVSNKISLERSLPEARGEECLFIKYLKKLPNVSVIIIFHNEVTSVLLRTVYSVINRTPPELLHEVILVNDNSTESELYVPLQAYVNEHFNGKVKIKNLNERKGLIVTRMEGAKIATGEVLVFFDSHTEVQNNWLPPLLEPIAKNRRLATTPVIDNFDAETFAFQSSGAYGVRGGIDWDFVYKFLPRVQLKNIDKIKPYPDPIMLGCAFAIDRKFFWELGGYDEGFRIWNGENYELSFKLWLCADGLYQVPCSRITHSFRKINPGRQMKDDFVGRNFKRLAEVWLDEYKDVFYNRNIERFSKIDAGDLTKQHEVRKNLKCKPFKYFLYEIMPDMLSRYPIETKNLPVFASGQIKSVSNRDKCIDTLSKSEFDSIGIYECLDADPENIPGTQFFRLTFFKAIQPGMHDHCLDSYKCALPQCSYHGYGNQYWKYDHVNKMIINGNDVDNQKCLTGNFDKNELSVTTCDPLNDDQKWEFTFINMTALDSWESIYGYDQYIFGKKMNTDKMLPLDQSPSCS
ncbi:unnamed protein product [Diamesa hyperborea]